DELRAIADTLAFGRGVPVWLAALGERMAAVGAAHADGIILNWVSPEWTRRTIEVAEATTGRRPTVAVLLRAGPADALRRAADTYLTTFPNYRHHFARQGLGDADAVVAATCAPTPDAAVLADRVAAYHAAGADVVGVYPADLD